MNEAQVVLERHEQCLKVLEKDIEDLRSLQSEIRGMSKTLASLTTELKHTNEHLARHEKKIDTIENEPKIRLQQIVTAIIAAISGGAVSVLIGLLI